MNNKQLANSISEAVCDGIQKEWITEEKEFIENDFELQNQLEEWLNNSLIDTCWHPNNYKIIRNLTSLNFRFIRDFFEDEEMHIPF